MRLQVNLPKSSSQNPEVEEISDSDPHKGQTEGLNPGCTGEQQFHS